MKQSGMRQSQLFTKTRREAPSDEVSKNAQLLIRAGFIHKEMAGVYTMLPLGLRVMEKVTGIIGEEMDAIGGIRMKTSALQSKEVWEKTNRWSDDVVDNWFKTILKNGTEVGLSFTNEEAYSNIVKGFVSSYKDLPIYPYDFKTIFRNEARSKSGIMRGREFYWKALYSFSTDLEQHNQFYEKAKQAYFRIYNRVGLGDLTYLTFASGGTFSKFSHEFQTLSEAGEDTIFVDEQKRVAVNKEVVELGTLKEITELGYDDTNNLVEKKAIEVGNIFTLGSKFSEPFGLTYKNAQGEDVPVFMGSYGIGITRLIGTVVEVLSDEKGIVWPKTITPFHVHLLGLGKDGDDSLVQASAAFEVLQTSGIEVLFDDRVASPGEKFADADLIGIPLRVVISARSLENGGAECVVRATGESQIVPIVELSKFVTDFYGI